MSEGMGMAELTRRVGALEAALSQLLGRAVPGRTDREVVVAYLCRIGADWRAVLGGSTCRECKLARRRAVANFTDTHGWSTARLCAALNCSERTVRSGKRKGNHGPTEARG